MNNKFEDLYESGSGFICNKRTKQVVSLDELKKMVEERCALAAKKQKEIDDIKMNLSNK